MQLSVRRYSEPKGSAAHTSEAPARASGPKLLGRSGWKFTYSGLRGPVSAAAGSDRSPVLLAGGDEQMFGAQ